MCRAPEVRRGGCMALGFGQLLFSPDHARQLGHRDRDVQGIAAEAIELGNDQHVSSLEPFHQLHEAGTQLDRRAARNGFGHHAILVDLETAHLDLADLVLGRLAACGDADRGEGVGGIRTLSCSETVSVNSLRPKSCKATFWTNP
jgi:hypothetical protein